MKWREWPSCLAAEEHRRLLAELEFEERYDGPYPLADPDKRRECECVTRVEFDPFETDGRPW